jgi:hypothetical protein
MTISNRELGEYTFQYADYEVNVYAKWVDHHHSHERTPRYEVRAYAKRIDGEASERFTASSEAPVEIPPTIFGFPIDNLPWLADLLGKQAKSVNLETLVENACTDIRTQIDGMYADIGIDEAEQQFQVRVEAEAAVESWTDV